MSDLIEGDVERIVGAPRDAARHLGRAVSADQRLYIMHSQECLDSTPDLRDCEFSHAMGVGINPSVFPEDVLVDLSIGYDELLERSHLVGTEVEG